MNRRKCDEQIGATRTPMIQLRVSHSPMKMPKANPQMDCTEKEMCDMGTGCIV